MNLLILAGVPGIFAAGAGLLSFDHVISTMPLTLLIQKIGGPAEIIERAKQLKFRNTTLIYIKVESKNPFPDQWIYVHAENLRTGRITNFRNWNEAISKGQTSNIVCLEYWCYQEDEIWTSEDSTLISLAMMELYSTKLVESESISDGFVQRVPKCYPVYSSGYREILIPIQEYLNTVERITPIGRYGRSHRESRPQVWSRTEVILRIIRNREELFVLLDQHSP